MSHVDYKLLRKTNPILAIFKYLLVTNVLLHGINSLYVELR